MADDFELPDESEQLDQLQPEDTLVDRGVSDVLDEGYIAPDHWSPAQGFGNTPAEAAQGETLDQRITQEVPDIDPTEEVPFWNEGGESREVGSRRAGRLVAGDNSSGEPNAAEVGIDGGVACAEEAAMYVIEGSEEEDPNPIR